MFDGSRRLGSGNGLRFGLAGAAGVVEAAEVAEVADDAAALPDVPSALEPVELDRLPNPEPPNPEPPLKLLVGGLDLAGGCEPGRVDGVPNEADEAGGDDVAPDLEDAPPNEPRDVVPSEGRPSAVDRPMPGRPEEEATDGRELFEVPPVHGGRFVGARVSLGPTVESVDD